MKLRCSQFPLIACLILASTVAAFETGRAETGARRGQLGESLYTIRIPETWNRGVVLFNHGYIPEQAELAASLPYLREPFASLLERGYLLAASSYRRNGRIVADAVEDVIQLHNMIIETYGQPAETLLIGTSMGGAITLHLLEQYPERFNGAMVWGRGLEVEDPGTPVSLRYRVEDPVLFLTNRDETEAPAAYREAAARTSNAPLALWIVDRDGHINLSEAEMKAAAEALIAVSKGASIALDKRINQPQSSPPSIAEFSARSRVSDVIPDYGNLEVYITAEDLRRLGLEAGDAFILDTGNNRYTVTLGTKYGDVPRGAWVAFINEFARLQVAINYGNASRVSGLHIGDPVVLRSTR